MDDKLPMEAYRHHDAYARVHTNDSDVLILTLYGVFAAYHCINRGRTYRPPHKALPTHIASGFVEIVLYYGGWQCSLTAVAACWTHSITSLMLVRELPNGHAWHTRPTYQAGSFLRAGLIALAYVTKDPLDYHDAIMPLHGFVYTRALLFLCGIMGPHTALKSNINLRESYSLAVFGAALISVGHCSSPWAVALYLAMVSLIGILSRWTSQPPMKVPFSQPAAGITSLLRAMGICHYQGGGKAPHIGDLDGDRIGEFLMHLISKILPLRTSHVTADGAHFDPPKERLIAEN